jgi:hypothetical protein
MTKHTCKWWIKTDEQCGAPTKFKLVLDDDGNRVRNYDAFCPEHRARCDSEVDDTEEGLALL